GARQALTPPGENPRVFLSPGLAARISLIPARVKPRRTTYLNFPFKEPAMKHVWGTFAFAAILCVASAADRSRAGDQPEPGFTSLFNGKDLTGWKYYKEKLDGKT